MDPNRRSAKASRCASTSGLVVSTTVAPLLRPVGPGVRQRMPRVGRPPRRDLQGEPGRRRQDWITVLEGPRSGQRADPLVVQALGVTDLDAGIAQVVEPSGNLRAAVGCVRCRPGGYTAAP